MKEFLEHLLSLKYKQNIIKIQRIKMPFFSLNNDKIYKILIPEYVIQSYKDNILIGNNSNNTGFFFYKETIYDKDLLNNPKIYDFEQNNELTEGEDKFNELEIFEVYFN